MGRWAGALLPVAMTLTVIAFGVREAIAAGGVYRQPDEGTAAHLFQILMPLQLPIIAAFAATQLEAHRTWTLSFLTVQIGLAVALFAAVAALGL